MHKIPVFLASDENYSPFIATTIASICDNTKAFINFYVLDGGITAFTKKLIAGLGKQFKNFSIEYIRIDIEKEFGTYRKCQGAFVSRSTYSRLLIPQLMTESSKVIYSDVDVVFIGDIVEFYEQELDGHIIGAVQQVFYKGERGVELARIVKKMDISQTHSYFYTGNLLIDCVKWRGCRITQKCIDIESEYRFLLTYDDQDILNKCFDGDYQILDNRFCLCSQDMEYFDACDRARLAELKQTCIVRHFETASKPWLVNSFHGKPLWNFNDFWFYAAMTPFFPGLQQNFVAFQEQNSMASQAGIGSIKRPDKIILANLRTRVMASANKNSSVQK
jgi:lipopolysaccharide biosynthesis glycosyltransferase